MKANEFIKEHGLDEAKKLVKENDLNHLYLGSGLYGDDLKHLIESHDLVASYGGVDKAHEYALSVWRSNKNDPFIAKMKQAIADVESCL